MKIIIYIIINSFNNKVIMLICLSNENNIFLFTI